MSTGRAIRAASHGGAVCWLFGATALGCMLTTDLSGLSTASLPDAAGGGASTGGGGVGGGMSASTTGTAPNGSSGVVGGGGDGSGSGGMGGTPSCTPGKAGEVAFVELAHCFWLSGAQTWPDARAQCIGWGGHLV